MMRGSNMGILPYWPNILLITWGLLLHKVGSLSFLSCVVTWSGSVLKRPPVYPLKFAFQKSFVISLGALVVSEPTRHLLIGDSHQIIWGHGQV